MQNVANCECPPLSTAVQAFRKAFFDAKIVSKDDFLANVSTYVNEQWSFLFHFLPENTYKAMP